ncbi:hypothetical protein Tco_0233655 [Tanacetum coccineum]
MVEDIPVDVPNILPTHPTLHMDFDFIPSHNDLGSDLDVSSPSEDRNKIYDPRICIEVESMKLKFSITVSLLRRRNLLFLYHIGVSKLPRLPGFLKPLVLAVFVLRSLKLQILSFIWEIQYPNLID